MTAFIDTKIMVGHLAGDPPAMAEPLRSRSASSLWCSQIGSTRAPSVPASA